MFAGYKIVLLPSLFKAQLLDDLWITRKNLKNGKYTLTYEKRAYLAEEKCHFWIDSLLTSNKNIFLDL